MLRTRLFTIIKKIIFDVLVMFVCKHVSNTMLNKLIFMLKMKYLFFLAFENIIFNRREKYKISLKYLTVNHSIQKSWMETSHSKIY